MLKRPDLGLTKWLAILVLGTVVPLLVFSGFTLQGIHRTSRAQADRGQLDTTRALALAVDGELRVWMAALSALAESKSIQPGRLAEFYEEARQVGAHHDGWVVLTVASGEQLFNTLRPYGAPLQKTSSPETIQAIFRDGAPIVSDLIWGQNAQQYLIAVAVPVVRGGKVVQCLTLNFAPDRLNRLLQRQQLPATWVAAINDRERKVVARSVLAEERVGKPVVDWFAAATRTAESGVATGPLMDGRLGQIAFQRLQTAPWIVALAVPVSELQSGAPIWGFLSVGAILLLLAAGMAIYIGREMTRPVRRMARVSQDLLRGEPGDLGPPPRIREVQELRQALVVAASSARAHAAERERNAEALRQANAELEQRVAERTAALESSNKALQVANALLQEEIAQRKHAEEEIQTLARFPSENPNPVLRLDPEGRILFANAASASLLEQWRTPVGSQAPAPWPDIVRDAMTHRPSKTIELMCGDCTYAVFVAPVPEAGYVNLYMSEITDRKRAEEVADEARRSLEAKTKLLQSVMNGARSSHLVYLDRDFNFVHVNETYAKTSGRAPEEIIGKNHFALYPHAENEAIFARARATGQPEEFHDKPFVFPDQPERGITYWDWTLIPVKNTSGHVTGFVFSLIETTERKRAEMALEAARAEAVNEKNRLEAVMQALPVGMALVNAHGGNIRANTAYEQVWGSPRPPVRTVADYAAYQAWWPDTGQLVQPADWASAQAVRQKRPVIGQLLEIQRFDGTRAFVLNSAAPILDAEGEAIGAAVVIQDITDLRTAQEALRSLNSELEQRVRERTAELSQAVETLERQAAQLRTLTTELTLAEQRERRRLADVLHDELQQLLVATRLRAHMLGRTEDQNVRIAALEIVELVEKALADTRSLSGELNPPGLQRGGLLQALEWLARRVAETHHLRVDLASPSVPLPLLPGDTAVLLYQAVRECLLNTAKYAQVSEATVTVAVAGPALAVTVADAGVGFDPERLRVAGGTDGGVGLLGIRERLEWVGGRLEISSAPGRGSRFTLVVPLGGSDIPSEAFAASAPAEPDSASPPARRLRVLVVDDHALVRRGFATLLSGEADLEVVGEADNGQRAIELSRQLAPDVVLMDVNMPIMNGIDATRAIHAEFPAIRVIGLSIFEDPGHPEAMRRAGAVGYVSKNASTETLLAAIRGGTRETV